MRGIFVLSRLHPSRFEGDVRILSTPESSGPRHDSNSSGPLSDLSRSVPVPQILTRSLQSVSRSLIDTQQMYMPRGHRQGMLLGQRQARAGVCLHGKLLHNRRVKTEGNTHSSTSGGDKFQIQWVTARPRCVLFQIPLLAATPIYVPKNQSIKHSTTKRVYFSADPLICGPWLQPYSLKVWRTATKCSIVDFFDPSNFHGFVTARRTRWPFATELCTSEWGNG